MKNKFLIGFAVVGALVFSGMLGKGDLLGVKTAFGYGSSADRTSYVPSPTITVQTPVNGGSYAHGAVLSIAWSAANGAFVKYKVSYTADGSTWISVSDNATGTALSWTVPDNSTTVGKVKVDGYDYNGALLASGQSNGTFTIVGTTPAPVAPVATPPATTTPAPTVDPTVKGSYNAIQAKANNPSINDDKALPVVANPACAAGDLIKGTTLPSVYYCGADGKRYVFVNDKAYFSWYADFSGVKTLSDEDLAKITIGGNVTYRPGTRMIKIVSDPKVYVIARGGTLRWVASEDVAKQLFGADWNKMIDDVADSFFVNYKIGDPVAL